MREVNSTPERGIRGYLYNVGTLKARLPDLSRKNMEIRAAHESELAQVVELSCLAFNPDGHERYWQYLHGDSSYRPSQTRVVVVNEQVVSTLRVWERRIRMGTSIVTMGGIGGVCTHPKYRGVGYASALMRDTIGYLRTIGCDIGMLFTIIPNDFYHQLGWTTFPLQGFHIAPGDAKSVANDNLGQVVAFALETHLDSVARLYDTCNAVQSGSLIRTRAYWDMQPSRIREVLPTVVAYRAREPVSTEGYLNYCLDGERAEVREVAYRHEEPTVLDALVFHLLRECEKGGVRDISGTFPPSHPFVTCLGHQCNAPVKQTWDSSMMLYAVNFQVLLQRLVLEWQSRLAASGEKFPALAVKFTLNGQQAVLRFDGNETLQILNDDANAVNLALTEDELWKLLFGEFGWEQANPGTSVPPETVAFLTTLFPKRDVIFWTPDRY